MWMEYEKEEVLFLFIEEYTNQVWFFKMESAKFAYELEILEKQEVTEDENRRVLNGAPPDYQIKIIGDQ